MQRGTRGGQISQHIEQPEIVDYAGIASSACTRPGPGRSRTSTHRATHNGALRITLQSCPLLAAGPALGTQEFARRLLGGAKGFSDGIAPCLVVLQRHAALAAERIVLWHASAWFSTQRCWRIFR